MLDPLARIQQLHRAIPVREAGKTGYQLADSRTVNISDLVHIEQHFLVTTRLKDTNRITQAEGAFSRTGVVAQPRR